MASRFVPAFAGSADDRRLLQGSKIVAVAGSILATCAVAASCLLARNLYDGTVQITQHDLRSLTTLLAEHADRTLVAVEGVEDRLAAGFGAPGSSTGRDFAAEAMTTSMRNRLDASASALPQVVALAIVDARGKVLNASRGWPAADADVAERDFFRTLTGTAAERTTAIASMLGRDGVTMTLYVSHRLANDGGGTLGFVLGAVDMRYFERLYATVSQADADVISMVSTDRVMLARHPSPPGAIGRVVPPVPDLRRDAGDPEGSGVSRMTTPIDGRDRFIAIRSLDRYPLIVGASRTVDIALVAWRRQTLALGVAVALLAGALWLLLRTNARQVRDRLVLASTEAARSAAEARAEGDRRFREQHARFGSALDGMAQGLCVFDAGEHVVFVNARMAALFGLPASLRRVGATLADVLSHLGEVVPGPHGAAFVAELRAAATSRRPATLACVLADERILGVTVEPVAEGDLVCTFEDQTERRRTERTIAHLAHHDALTGLPNRLPLDEAIRRLSDPSDRRRGAALLLLDLDGFKPVNDVHGHPFGDALLRAVADRLREVVDEGDLVARLGGDEFAVVHGLGSPPATAGGQALTAIALAGRIVRALGHPFTVGDVPITIGTSVGIAPADGPGRTPERLLQEADTALYRAKDEGRGTWCLFGPGPDQGAWERDHPRDAASEEAARGAGHTAPDRRCFVPSNCPTPGHGSTVVPGRRGGGYAAWLRREGSGLTP